METKHIKEKLEAFLRANNVGEQTDTPPSVLASFLVKQIDVYESSVKERASHFHGVEQATYDCAYDG